MPITLHIDGRMPVAKLKDDFKNSTGCSLRVYRDLKGHLAEDGMHLSDVRLYRGAPAVGDFDCRPNLTVGGFCERMRDEFGIEVKVASPDDWVLADDRLTLSEVAKLKSQTTKREMEQIALSLANDFDENNLNFAAEELKKKGRQVRDRDLQDNADDVVDILSAIKDFIRTRDLQILVTLINQYPITDIIALVGSILTGNVLSLTNNTIQILKKSYTIFLHYSKK